MKIKKVTRIQDEGMDGLEVVIEDEGKETIQCFEDAEAALEEIDSEPAFIKTLKEIVPKLKDSDGELPVEKKKTELKKFKNKEVIL